MIEIVPLKHASVRLKIMQPTLSYSKLQFKQLSYEKGLQECCTITTSITQNVNDQHWDDRKEFKIALIVRMFYFYRLMVDYDSGKHLPSHLV